MPINNLRKNKFILLAVLTSFLSACTTSSYKINAQGDNAIELAVTSNRVLVECEYQEGYDGDIKNPHGFMMHVLDEENTVFSLILPRVVTQKDCITHLKATTKILKSFPKVYIGGAGTFDGPKSKSENKYIFPGLGNFPGNERVLNYWAIWTDTGQCYDVIYGNEKPCPREKFPVKKLASP